MRRLLIRRQRLPLDIPICRARRDHHSIQRRRRGRREQSDHDGDTAGRVLHDADRQGRQPAYDGAGAVRDCAGHRGGRESGEGPSCGNGFGIAGFRGVVCGEEVVMILGGNFC